MSYPSGTLHGLLTVRLKLGISEVKTRMPLRVTDCAQLVRRARGTCRGESRPLRFFPKPQVDCVLTRVTTHVTIPTHVTFNIKTKNST